MHRMYITCNRDLQYKSCHGRSNSLGGLFRDCLANLAVGKGPLGIDFSDERVLEQLPCDGSIPGVFGQTPFVEKV
jgi:hypothetical protein